MREIEHCPICRSSDRKFVYAGTVSTSDILSGRNNPYGSHYQINACASCGLVYSSPIFDDGDIAALYEQAPHGNVSSGEEDNVRRTMRRYYDLARPFLQGRENMLDIGCDIGLMLEFAREDGFRGLYGLEPNPVARAKSAAIPGAMISDKFYEQHEFPDKHFDLITFIHVIDHLVDPSKAVERAWRHLKPGGLVVAVVHNIESLLARVMGEHFPPFNLYHHYFFSKTTLRRLFESQGFEAAKVGSTKNCYSVGFFTRRVPGLADSVRIPLGSLLDKIGIGRISVTIPVGNIGIVARRPLDS